MMIWISYLKILTTNLTYPPYPAKNKTKKQKKNACHVCYETQLQETATDQQYAKLTDSCIPDFLCLSGVPEAFARATELDPQPQEGASDLLPCAGDPSVSLNVPDCPGIPCGWVGSQWEDWRPVCCFGQSHRLFLLSFLPSIDLLPFLPSDVGLMYWWQKTWESTKLILALLRHQVLLWECTVLHCYWENNKDEFDLEVTGHSFRYKGSPRCWPCP